MSEPKIVKNHFGVIYYSCGCVIESGYMMWCRLHQTADELRELVRRFVDTDFKDIPLRSGLFDLSNEAQAIIERAGQ